MFGYKRIDSSVSFGAKRCDSSVSFGDNSIGSRVSFGPKSIDTRVSFGDKRVEKLVADANCTEEQIDAVAQFTLSLQRRSDGRPDKTKLLLPWCPRRATTERSGHLCLSSPI